MSCRCDDPEWKFSSGYFVCVSCGGNPGSHSKNTPTQSLLGRTLDDATGEEWNRASAAIRSEPAGAYSRPAKHIATIPASLGKVVGIAEFRGQLIVATENAVLRLDGNELVPLQFRQEAK